MLPSTSFPSRRALIIGGTRGIGLALANLLGAEGWETWQTGHAELDLTNPKSWGDFFQKGPPWFDVVFFCAGELRPRRWFNKSADDYLRSYWIHALGPLLVLAEHKSRFPWWTRVVFVSTVGVISGGTVDAGYSASKAALERMAATLRTAEAWKVIVVRLDLVDTGTLDLLPTETLQSRKVLTPDEAAALIYQRAMSDKPMDWQP